MKNLFSLSLVVVLFALFLTGCDKEDSPTVAKITVLESNMPQATVSVYMFDELAGPNTSFFEPFFASKTVVTEANGVATFNLQEVYDLNVIGNQTTLYFGVFDSNDNVLGSTGLTIEKGKTKSATISY